MEEGELGLTIPGACLYKDSHNKKNWVVTFFFLFLPSFPSPLVLGILGPR